MSGGITEAEVKRLRAEEAERREKAAAEAARMQLAVDERAEAQLEAFEEQKKAERAKSVTDQAAAASYAMRRAMRLLSGWEARVTMTSFHQWNRAVLALRAEQAMVASQQEEILFVLDLVS